MTVIRLEQPSGYHGTDLLSATNPKGTYDDPPPGVSGPNIS